MNFSDINISTLILSKYTDKKIITETIQNCPVPFIR